MVLHSTGCGRVGRRRHSTLYMERLQDLLRVREALLFVCPKPAHCTVECDRRRGEDVEIAEPDRHRHVLGAVQYRDPCSARPAGCPPRRVPGAGRPSRVPAVPAAAPGRDAALRGTALRGASSCCRQRLPDPPVARCTSASSPRDRTTLVCPSRSCWLCVCGRRAPRGRGTLRGVLERGPRVIELP